MNRRNYQREMEKIAQDHEKKGEVPRVLMHSCCGPCSTSCMERLTSQFDVTILYYNPNIYPETEYAHRVREQERLVDAFPHKHELHFQKENYDPREFYDIVKGYEAEPEGGARCFLCYELRLRRAAEVARKEGFDYFTTTLSVSPLKNADKLNEIGERVGREVGIPWLVSDFKKKNGYLRSVELSEEFGMYRQDYCGCVYSLRRDLILKKDRNI